MGVMGFILIRMLRLVAEEMLESKTKCGTRYIYIYISKNIFLWLLYF